MKILSFIRNHKFLAVIIFIYLVLGVTIPQKAIESLGNSLYYIKEMIIIMPVIMLLTSLIEAWVPKESIQTTLGDSSGAKGFLFSFLLGSFSAGPIYAAFPVCKTLLNKGASIPNIVVILSAWAVIKVPMLANEAKFLGVEFTFIRWILTTISIFLMAYIMGRFIKREEIVSTKNEFDIDEELLDLYIEKDYCVGCGLCVKLSSENFILSNKKAEVITRGRSESEYEELSIIIKKCPVGAIKSKIKI